MRLVRGAGIAVVLLALSIALPAFGESDQIGQVKTASGEATIVRGYTDTVADAGFNEKLGLERADRIRRALIRDGVGERTISVASRGKTDLLVPTPDQVAEPHNRRVEVTVR